MYMNDLSLYIHQSTGRRKLLEGWNDRPMEEDHLLLDT